MDDWGLRQSPLATASDAIRMVYLNLFCNDT